MVRAEDAEGLQKQYQESSDKKDLHGRNEGLGSPKSEVYRLGKPGTGDPVLIISDVMFIIPLPPSTRLALLYSLAATMGPSYSMPEIQASSILSTSTFRWALRVGWPALALQPKPYTNVMVD